MKMLAAPTIRRIMRVTLRRRPRKYQLPGREFLRPFRSTMDCEATGSLGGHADEHSLLAHAARRPRRCRGREPPVARPGGVHPPGQRRDLLVAPLGSPGATQRRADRPGGDGRGRRPGGPAPDRPAARALGAERPRHRVRTPDVQAPRPQGDRLLPLADGGGVGHQHRRSGVRLLSRPAAEPLPDQLEVPRRAAAPLRAPARPRVPHEGRVLLRPRPRRSAGELPAHVRRLRAGVLPLRPDVSRGRSRIGRDGRVREPRVHGRRRRRRGRLRLVPELRLCRQRRSRARRGSLPETTGTADGAADGRVAHAGDARDRRRRGASRESSRRRC